MEQQISAQDRPHLLAWAGWRMRIDPDWRPLGIDGTDETGSMVVGTFDQTLISIEWQHVDARRFKPERWLKKHLGAASLRRYTASGITLTSGLRELAWVPDERIGTQPVKAVWCGFHEETGLVLQVVMNLLKSPSLARRFTASVLPSVAVTPPGTPVFRSIFDSAFTTPAGYRLVRRRLKLGDLSMQFAGPAGEHLTLRQIYPASTALERRKLDRWLNIPVFKSSYRFPDDLPTEPWQTAAGSRTLTGLRRKGLKKLPWPLGLAFKKGCRAAIVHDPDTDRLLAAELETRGMPEDAAVTDILSGMSVAQEHAA